MNYSRYSQSQETRQAIPGGRILGIIFLAGIFLALLLGQLHMKFAMNDLQRETTKLQERKMELLSDLNSLKGEVESYKQGNALLKYAEAELGMVHYPPSEWERMVVADDLSERFDERRVAALLGDDHEGVRRNSEGWAERLAAQLDPAADVSALSQ